MESVLANTLPNFLEGTVDASLWQKIVLSASIFAVVFVALWVCKYVLLKHLQHLAKRTHTVLDDMVIDALKSVRRSTLVAVALYASVQHLALPTLLQVLIQAFFLVMIVSEFVQVGERFFLFAVSRRLSKDKEEKQASAAIGVMARIVLWSIGLLLILANLGFNVTSLIAGLGIGGLAISLALQSVFQDVFSSFAILLDKPFEEGDYIVLGDQKGTVQRIGLKTTRIQTLQGEELVVSNTELTSTRIHNFKQLKERRILFTVGVTYDTAPEVLKRIPEMIEAIAAQHEHVRLDRVHLKEMADSSLNFEVVYYVLSDEYNVYMDAQQTINLGILEKFAAENIEIAYPTQTVYVEKS